MYLCEAQNHVLCGFGDTGCEQNRAEHSDKGCTPSVCVLPSVPLPAHRNAYNLFSITGRARHRNSVGGRDGSWARGRSPRSFRSCTALRRRRHPMQPHKPLHPRGPRQQPRLLTGWARPLCAQQCAAATRAHHRRHHLLHRPWQLHPMLHMHHHLRVPRLHRSRAATFPSPQEQQRACARAARAH